VPQEEGFHSVIANAILAQRKSRKVRPELLLRGIGLWEDPMSTSENKYLFWLLLSNQTKESLLSTGDLLLGAIVESLARAANAIRKEVEEHDAPPESLVIFVTEIISDLCEKPDLPFARNNSIHAFPRSIGCVLFTFSTPMGITNYRNALVLNTEFIVRA